MAGLRHRRGDPWAFARPAMAIGVTNLGEGEDDLGLSPWSIHRMALTNRGEDEDDAVVSVSGTAASSGAPFGCVGGSSSGCTLIVYDAMNDAIEGPDTGTDEEAPTTGDGAAEAGDQ